jgi:hypothetical protein
LLHGPLLHGPLLHRLDSAPVTAGVRCGTLGGEAGHQLGGVHPFADICPILQHLGGSLHGAEP